MKKTVSFLVASFLITSAYAGEKIVLASAASTQTKAVVVVKAKAAVKAEKRAPIADYALESFGCCGLPQ
jgi:hypothetical protein